MHVARALPLATLMLAACTTRVHEPNVARPSARAEPADSQQQEAPVEPAVPARLRQALDAVTRAMSPLCAARCGTASLVVSADIDATAHARVEIPGYSLIEVRSDEVEGLLAGPSSILVWVVAHEYGHHLDVTAGRANEGGEWGMELRAEAAAGCALVHMGMPLDPVLELSRRSEHAAGQRVLLADQFGADPSHPHWRHMRRAILAGHQACSGGAQTLDEVADSVASVTTEALAARSPLLRAPARSSQGAPDTTSHGQWLAPVQGLSR